MFFPGKLQTVNYVSDALGFRVVATNLPKAVDIPDSLEIAEAKKQHFKAHQDHIELLAKSKDETENEWGFVVRVEIICFFFCEISIKVLYENVC